MGRPGTIEPIDLLPQLVPVIPYRLTGHDLEVLPAPVVGVLGHAVCFLGIVVGLVRHVTDARALSAGR